MVKKTTLTKTPDVSSQTIALFLNSDFSDGKISVIVTKILLQRIIAAVSPIVNMEKNKKNKLAGTFFFCKKIQVNNAHAKAIANGRNEKVTKDQVYKPVALSDVIIIIAIENAII